MDANERIIKIKQIAMTAPDVSRRQLITMFNDKYPNDKMVVGGYSYKLVNQAIAGLATLPKIAPPAPANDVHFLPPAETQKLNQIHLLSKKVGGYNQLTEIAEVIVAFGPDRFLKAIQSLKALRESLDND